MLEPSILRAKALANLRICVDLPEPLILIDAMSSIMI